MAVEKLSILVDLKSNTAGILDAQRKTASLTKELVGLSSKASRMAQAWRTGFSVNVINQFAHALRRVGHEVSLLIKDSISLSSSMEKTKVAIAGMFQAAGNYETFQEGFSDAGVAIDALKDKAEKTSASFTTLAQGFMKNFGGMRRAGITLVKDQIELVSLVNTYAQTRARAGQEAIQSSQELKALLEGRKAVGNDLVKILEAEGISVKKSIAEGTLFQDFKESELGLSLMNTELELYKTNIGAIEAFKDVFKQKQIEVIAPLYAKLGDSARRWINIIKDPAITDQFKNIVSQVSSVLGIFERLILYIIQTEGLLTKLSIAFQVLFSILAGVALVKTTSLLVKLGGALLFANPLVIAFGAAIAAVTLVNFNSQIKIADATLRDWVDIGFAHAKNKLKHLQNAFEKFGLSITLNIQKAIATFINSISSGIQKAYQIVTNFKNFVIGTGGAGGIFNLTEPEDIISTKIIDKKIAGIKGFHERKKEVIDKETKEEITLIKETAKRKLKAQKEAEEKAGKELKDLFFPKKTGIRSSAGSVGSAAGSPKVEEEKETYIDGVLVKRAEKATELQIQLALISQELDYQAKTLDEKFMDSLSKIGVKAKSIQQDFLNLGKSLVSNISNGISAVILKTKTWKEALGDIASGVLKEVVQGVVKLGVGTLFSFLPGPLGLLGGAIRGFAEGGLVPHAPSSGGGDNILAGLKSGEYVIPESVVKNVGVGYLDSLKNTGRSRASSSSQNFPKQNSVSNINLAVVNSQRELKRFLSSREGKGHLIDMTRKASFSI